MLNYIEYIAAIQVAIFAVTFSDILTQPNMILEFYGNWLNRLELKHPKLAYPLGYCAKCFAGQISVWIFPFVGGFNPIAWISFVSATILTASFLSAFYSKATR